MTEEVFQQFDDESFKTKLIQWFDTNKRALPWRETKDPYKIWVSEIMLQQTKVDTVIDYYLRFLEAFPTVYDLAEAKEQDVLKLWEGLGYYSRARNLHTAAKDVVENHQGIMPRDPKALGELKGIGPYTKGAISSIAFQLPEPAVDGNVMRVLSRVLYIKDNISDAKTRRKFEQIIRELISKENPSYFNQGLMELGALICTPRSPSCLLCPVQAECRAFEVGEQASLPVKLKKVRQKEMKYFTFIIRDQDGNVAIEQRPSKGLLANMWQFPMIEKQAIQFTSIETLLQERYGIDVSVQAQLEKVQHIFTHLKWELDVYDVTLKQTTDGLPFTFVPKEALADYPFSVSHIRIMENI